MSTSKYRYNCDTGKFESVDIEVDNRIKRLRAIEELEYRVNLENKLRKERLREMTKNPPLQQ